MFVTLSVYRAREGEEDAIVALHEDWQHHLRARAGGYLSGELLHDAADRQLFVALARYESKAAALAVAHHPEQAAWQRRLESLCQSEPGHGEYHIAWQSAGEP